MGATPVIVRREPVVFPTYAPGEPQKNPMFLERRVYQGSSGRVYPLPVIDRIAEEPTPRAWDAVYLENEFLLVMLLPEIGGRIHVIRDKTNGYDLIYRQDAIKPALVGLAGPWLSGGIEFNWPQHHRPATYQPVAVEIEEQADGAKTVWLGDHDPLQRMKGMHGVRLHPGRAVVELRVRAYNRTPLPQTFLWWANVATEVHEGYQSFFPPDVHSVADHAKRATSAYPRCTGHYYGVNYAARRKHGIAPTERPTQFRPPYARNDDGVSRPSALRYAPNDLSWYANIPVPTSYMAMGSREDFFGGYDHVRRAGIVHIADHHISPGKKQWTWGNSAFGYAWDRNLTTPDAHGVYRPYIEIMAGVYTDNQPDFSFLQPGETKTWSQFWYPIREIGPAQQANVEAALSLTIEGRMARIGIAVTRRHPAARLIVSAKNRTVHAATLALAPDHPRVASVRLPRGVKATDVCVSVRPETRRAGRVGKGSASALRRSRACLISYQPRRSSTGSVVPPPAAEPAAPSAMASADQLYLTGLHLAQYRHATRMPEDYWREALRRDPGDSRCHQALGSWHLQRGEFAAAERQLRGAVARLTERNPNPADGEAHYTLGRTLRWLGRDDDAYDAFYKSTWNQAWQSAAFHALAEIDCQRRDWDRALEHLDQSLRRNADHLAARDLQAMVLEIVGRRDEAAKLVEATLALDPLDAWARWLGTRIAATAAKKQPPGRQPPAASATGFPGDTQMRLDLAHDLARAGFESEALHLLSLASPEPQSGTAPLVAYTMAWLESRRASATSVVPAKRGARRVRALLQRAAVASPDYCFPARLEELAILQWAASANPRDPNAPYLLGNLLYDRRRYDEAVRYWEISAQLRPRHAVVWRNLGLAYFNVRRQPAKARRAYDRAFAADDTDARVLFERDQLWKRVGVTPRRRLRELERHLSLVAERDDLTLELCALYNLTNHPEKSLALLERRRFQPWEGGEGQALGQHTRAHLALGQRSLRAGDAATARRHFTAALACPENLGEARHPLANASDIHFQLGEAADALGQRAEARRHWRAAAACSGDFQEMSVRSFSELTYFSARAWMRLGKARRGRRLLRDLLKFAVALERAEAKIDYFATSLPTMLLFDDNLTARQQTTARFLQAQAHLGLGDRTRARQCLRQVLRHDPNHLLASEFLADLRPAKRNR